MDLRSLQRKTEVIFGKENALAMGIRFMQNVKSKMDIYFDYRAPSIVIEIEAYKKGYIDIRKRNGKIRALTEITNDNIAYCKELMQIVDDLRHLDGLKGGLAVNETECMATTILQEGEPLTQVIYSNVKEIVEQQQYLFDIIWSKGIPAKQRMKEIEEGLKREFIDIIQDPIETGKVIFQLLNSAREEILVLFSKADTFRDPQKYSEMLNALKIASERDIKIRILLDDEDPINNMLQDLKEQRIKVQHHIKTAQTKISILVIDEAYCLTIEMRDSLATTFDDAIGLATYSNSDATISSYVSIFENLWMQSELFGQNAA